MTNLVKRLFASSAIAVLCSAPVCFAQAAGPASLQVPASSSAAVFSVVPILGISTQITPSIGAGVYGLYSTDPLVKILCVALPVRLNSVFSINPIYEFIAPPAGNSGRAPSEHQANLAVDASFKWHEFEFGDRNRAGRRFISGAPDSTRYRNLPSVTYRLPGRTKLSLFHWQEFFYEGHVNRWDQHHLAAGFQRPIRENLLGQLYYFRLAAVGRGSIHALGLTLVYHNDRPLLHQGAK